MRVLIKPNCLALTATTINKNSFHLNICLCRLFIVSFLLKCLKFNFFPKCEVCWVCIALAYSTVYLCHRINGKLWTPCQYWVHLFLFLFCPTVHFICFCSVYFCFKRFLSRTIYRLHILAGSTILFVNQVVIPFIMVCPCLVHHSVSIDFELAQMQFFDVLRVISLVSIRTKAVGPKRFTPPPTQLTLFLEQ